LCPIAAGVNVAFGHDCVMDPWYGMGCDYMLEVAHMGLHVAQMSSQKGIRACFDAVTSNAAKVGSMIVGAASRSNTRVAQGIVKNINLPRSSRSQHA